jgi:predicted PurR-regulated permease PerM
MACRPLIFEVYLLISSEDMKQVLRYTGYIVLIVLAGFLLYRFYFIGLWILMAAVLSFIGQPVAQFFDRLHIKKFSMPHGVSSFLAVLVMLLLVLGFIGIFVPLIVSQADTISQIDVDKITSNLEGPVSHIDDKLRQFGVIPAGESTRHFVIKSAKSLIGMGSVGNAVGGIISAAGNMFVGLFAIFFITFFFIKDENMFEDDLLLVIPEKSHKATHTVIVESKGLLKRYFIGMIFEVFAVMGLIALGLWILGIENPLLIGFFGGIMNIIPYLGPIIGSAIGMILGITATMAGGNYNELWPAIIKLGSVFAAVQLIDNNLLVPLIYAKSVKSHPLEIFLVIIMGGSLAGLIGMLLAVPVYTVLRVIAKEFFQQFRVVQKIAEAMDQK